MEVDESIIKDVFELINYQKIMRHFKNLGCKNEVSCSIACKICIDLIARNLSTVETFFNSDLDQIYFTAKDPLDDLSTDVYIPYSTLPEINFFKISKLQEVLGKDSKSIILATCDSTSTILYHKFSNQFN